MRPGGKDGKLYRVTFGETIQGAAGKYLTVAGFYRITGQGTPTGFPPPSPAMAAAGARALRVGDIFYAAPPVPLLPEDSVEPLSLTVISFVTDVQDQASGQSHDVTTQIDVASGTRAYLPAAFKERSGTISGVVDVDSPEQRELFGEYRMIVLDDGAGIGVFPAQTGEHEYMMSRRESLNQDDVEMWEYMPLITESLQSSKPMDGVQAFSFNYRVDGKRRPCLIYKANHDSFFNLPMALYYPSDGPGILWPPIGAGYPT